MSVGQANSHAHQCQCNWFILYNFRCNSISPSPWCNRPRCQCHPQFQFQFQWQFWRWLSPCHPHSQLFLPRAGDLAPIPCPYWASPSNNPRNNLHVHDYSICRGHSECHYEEGNNHQLRGWFHRSPNGSVHFSDKVGPGETSSPYSRQVT